MKTEGEGERTLQASFLPSSENQAQYTEGQLKEEESGPNGIVKASRCGSGEVSFIRKPTFEHSHGNSV